MSGTLLSKNDRMEALSRAYVEAIAAQTGYSVGQTNLDRDSVDLTIHAGGNMRPQIGIQLKATTNVLARASTFSFPLNIKNYNDLRITTQSPRILVVLEMPSKEIHWLDHNIQRLILRRCAYWKSLLNLPETQNTTTVSIQMDKSQVFDVLALGTMMQKSSAGVPL